MRRASAMFIVLVLSVLPALNACQQCPPTIFRDPPAFAVIDGYDGAAVPEVEATLTGADSNVRILDCEYVPSSGTTECGWPKGAPIVAGTYSLQITAPYFRSATVEEKVITSSYCGEGISLFQPEKVALQRL